MEDQIYETELLSYKEFQAFKKWLDKEIGTEYDTNQEDVNEYYIVIFDLVDDEVTMIRDYETKLERFRC